MTNSLLLSAYRRLPEPRDTEGFSTEVFLSNLGEKVYKEGSNTYRIIERLCKKVEVPRRLVIEYTDDLEFTVNDSPVAPEFAIYFTLVLLEYATENKDLKFLNCALKIVDGYLQEPQIVVTDEIRKLASSAAKVLL